MKKTIIIDVPDEHFTHALVSLAYKVEDGEWWIEVEDEKHPLRELPRKRKTQVLWFEEDKKPYLATHEPSEYDRGWNDCVSFLLGEEE